MYDRVAISGKVEKNGVLNSCDLEWAHSFVLRRVSQSDVVCAGHNSDTGHKDNANGNEGDDDTVNCAVSPAFPLLFVFSANLVQRCSLCRAYSKV